MLRRFLILAALTMVATGAPLSAAAAEACRILSDPVGDVDGLNHGYGAGVVLLPDQREAAVDITGLSLAYDAETLVGTLAVHDLRAGETKPSASYSMSMRIEDATLFLSADRGPFEWRFWRSVLFEDGTSVNERGTGTVDLDAGTISVPVSLTELRNPGRGTIVSQVNASATLFSNDLIVQTSPGGDTTSLGRFIMREDCSALQAATQLCTVLTDEEGDFSYSSPAPANPHTDLTAVAVGTTADAITVTFTLAALGPIPDGVEYERWTLWWKAGREDLYRIEASRDRYGSATGSYWGPTRGSDGFATFDEAARTVTVLVARSAPGLADGANMREFNADAVSGSSLFFGSNTDNAWQPWDSTRAYTIGVGCSTVRGVCPVVVDEPGDAGPVLFTPAGNVPENEPLLDLLSAGAHNDADVMTVSVRVADLNAGAPLGTDMVGWTVSWLGTDLRRYYAQAERRATGLVFRYGVDPQGAFQPSGPRFDGAATNGALDAQSGVVSIDVPMSVMRSPEAGAQLRGFGATSWAVQSGSTAAAFRVVDEAQGGTYVVGQACDA